MEGEKFCPITGTSCRSDCAWLEENISIDNAVYKMCSIRALPYIWQELDVIKNTISDLNIVVNIAATRKGLKEDW